MLRWKHRPTGSNWGDFGDDDQLGRLNLLTPKKVLEGILEVSEGRTFCLSLPLNLPGGQVLTGTRQPPRLFPSNPDGRPRFNYITEPGKAIDIECDDGVVMWLQYSTQWDSLSHIGALFDSNGDGTPEIVYYNGFRAEQDIRVYPENAGPSGGDDGTGGAHALDIATMAAHGVQGRGVMIDLARYYGNSPGPHAVGFEELMRAAALTAAHIEPGDMLCLYTGFSDLLLQMAGRPDPTALRAGTIALDGRDPKLLDWITHSGVAALISDNFAVELFPSGPPDPGDLTSAPLHHHCIFKLGIPLGELWQLNELALWLRQARRCRFLLTAPPLRLPRAVGSPTSPIATV